MMPTEPVLSRTATATILFTDLVGSTAQRAQLGEEAAETLRRTHDQLLTDAVAASRGTVAKHVGDGIMATFTGAADAVAAAVAIQQAVDGHNRRAGSAPLALRIGISLGDVTWEQRDCFGIPVIEAARLCAAAEGGQILAADLVRLRARGRGGRHAPRSRRAGRRGTRPRPHRRRPRRGRDARHGARDRPLRAGIRRLCGESLCRSPLDLVR